MSSRAAAAVVGPSLRTVRAVTVANLGCQVGIVVTGGLVRLTGSGLGCPTWPQCVPGSYIPVVTQPEGYHKSIEFGNRLLTFVLGVVAIATFVVVWRYVRSGHAARDGRPAGRGLVVLGAIPLLGVLTQAVLGGVTVLTSLHPATVAAHFLLSIALIAASTVLVLRLRDPVAWPVPARAEIRWLVAGLVAVAVVVQGLGTIVTGSGPHSGDADGPARFDLDPRTMSWLHADAVMVFVGLLLALVLVLRLVDAPSRAQRRARWLVAVTLVQGLVGYAQYATGLPVSLVALHMLGASLLTIALTGVALAVLDGRAPSATVEPSGDTAVPQLR